MKREKLIIIIFVAIAIASAVVIIIQQQREREEELRYIQELEDTLQENEKYTKVGKITIGTGQAIKALFSIF